MHGDAPLPKSEANQCRERGSQHFIGSHRDTSTTDFLDKYARHFSVPTTGPEIAMIQLETPFARIVEHSEHAVSYNAPDVVQDFYQHPPEFRLRVQIYFTPSYGAIASSANSKVVFRPDDFWRDFKIELIQGTERIRASRAGGPPPVGTCWGRESTSPVDRSRSGALLSRD